MKIYTKDTLTFNNNGLGFLTDVLSCYITDEINGMYQLNMEYPKDGKLSEYLVEENIIKCKVADGTEQLFRIKIVEKDLKKINITAQHIYYDLLNNFLEDVYPQDKSAQAFINHLLSNTNFATQFTAVSSIATIKSARYVRKNPIEVIMGNLDNSVLNLFGGELKRDNFTINLLTRLGQDNGVKLVFGKNINGIDITIDITEMATRIMPQGFDGLLLPEKYIDSPLINNYPTPKVAKLEFDDVRYDPSGEYGYADIQDAYTALRAKVQEQFDLGIDKPKININVDWVELSKTNEYKNYINLEKVSLGDTITANILGVDYQTRVFATRYNVLKDTIDNFQIGTFNPTITNTISKIISEVSETLPSTLLEQAQATATELITSAMGGYIYKTQSELYIMDTDDPNTATKVWRWNLNGLGYSSNGINGPYSVAMTMNGGIVADFITTGTLSADRVNGGTLSGVQLSIGNDFSVDSTGKLTAKGANLNGSLTTEYSYGSVAWKTKISAGNIEQFVNGIDRVVVGYLPGILMYDINSNQTVRIDSGDGSAQFKGSLSAGNIDCGTCTLNSSSTVSVSFNKTFASTPKVVITPNTTSSGTIAPKIREVSTTGFKAIIGGSGFSNIVCDWIAIS